MLKRLLILLPLALASLSAQTTTLNLSTDLVTLGIATSNMVPNQPTLDATPLFMNGVKYAAAHKMTTVLASTGAYYFLSAGNSGTHILLSGISTPMTIDLQGSDLYFSHPEWQGFFVAGCSNLTLQNCTMDYSQQRYTQVLITSVNTTTRQIQYTIQPGWQTLSSMTTLYTALDPSGSAITYMYVFRNGQTISGATRIQLDLPLSDTSMTVDSSTLTSAITPIQPGDIGVINLRAGGTALLVTSPTNCTFRNIKIYAGVVGMRSTSASSTLFERVEVIPRPGTDRLISTVADGMSPSQSGANNILRLCRSIRTCDDAFSPNTYVYASVQTVLGASSLQVQGDVNTALNGNYALPNGSNVAFERPSDGAILGTATVTSQAAATAINGLPQVVLNFSQPLPSNLVGTYIYGTDPSWRSGGLLMERDTVQQQTWARGMSLWGLENTTVYGSYIHRSAWGGIVLMHQMPASTDWITPPVVNFTAANNVLDGTDTQFDTHGAFISLAGIQGIVTATAGPITGSPDQNISVTGNFIADPARSAIWIGNTTGGLANANYLFNPNGNPNLATAYAAFQSQELLPVVVESSQGVTVGSNPVDQSSTRAFVTDTGFKELAAYAPGSTFRLNAFNLGNLASPAVSLTDADGTSWPLSVVATSTHSVDVQLPQSVGLGGASVTFKSGASTYLGTLFVDSQDNISAINQATYLVSPSATTVPALGGSVSYLVVTQPGSSYTATDADSFATVGSTSVGTGVVTVTLAKNTTSLRTTVITIAGQPVTLTQAGVSDPIIVTQPLSQTLASGASALFSVTATGATSYQWYLNGTALSGATSTTLAVPAATSASAGTYTVVATNASGSATSNGALLSVTATGLPTISFHPANQTAPAGSSVSFAVGASGSGALTYQWIYNGVAIAGATNATYTITNAQAANVGVYAVQVTNGSTGGTITNLASLAVNTGGPTFTVQPATQTVVNGTTVVFSATATASVTPTYQWLFNNVALAGATGSRLVLTGATTANAGTYVCVATSGSVSTTSSPASLAFTSTTNVGRLVNLSVNTTAGKSQVLTVGFVVGGAGTTGTEPLLIRADGPALAAFGSPNTLVDPTLNVFSAGTIVASNDNWNTPASNGTAVTAADTATFAFPLTNTASLDAALTTSLAVSPGYTAQISGNTAASGAVLAELYDNTATYTATSPRLINVSSNENLAPGGTLTVGFSIAGTTSKTVLIRASGPQLALAPFNITGTMTDPQLVLHQGGSILATNAAWGGDPQITAAANSVYAFGLTVPTSKDAVILTTLPPGVYSAVAQSATGGGGTVIVEVYEIP